MNTADKLTGLLVAALALVVIVGGALMASFGEEPDRSQCTAAPAYQQPPACFR